MVQVFFFWRQAMKYGETVEVSRAVRNHFGLTAKGREDPVVRKWLRDTDPRCLIVLLIDAMGTSILEKHLDKDDFFRRNTVKSIAAVFPPTTTASVTSIVTGKYPCETAWMGWNQYFPEIDDNVIMFLGKSMYGYKEYGSYPEEMFPAEYQFETMRKMGIKADSVWPRWGEAHPSETIEEMAENILKLADDPEMEYIYAYWDEFDSLLHRIGPSAAEAGSELRHIQSVIEHMTERLPEDCALMVIADHSQIDITTRRLDEDSEICEMLEHDPALEPRTIAFYVRPEYRERFPEVFTERYGDIYRLYSKEEVLKKHLFGEGPENPGYAQFIGDFLAVAYTPVTLCWKRPGGKGDHAGGMEEEAYVPLILIPYVES